VTCPLEAHWSLPTSRAVPHLPVTSDQETMAVFAEMSSSLLELLSLVWMELAMIALASFGFLLFNGFPLAKNRAKKIAEEGPSEEDAVSRDLQQCLAEGRHLAAYKLWQRVKSFDAVPQGIPLFGVVDAMRQLGKTTEAILREFQTSMECNDSPFDADATQMLLEALRKDGQCSELVAGLTKIFEKRDSPKSASAKVASAGASADITRHVAMIKACSRESNLQGAVEAFDQLQSSGVSMNSMIYNSLLDACIQCQDSLRAFDLFVEMKAESFADVVSFNIMLKLLQREGKHKEAQQLLAEMRERGLQANIVTFNELINAKVNAGDRQGVWELVSEMQSAGVSPNVITCSILLKALTARSRSDDVSRTMDLVQQSTDSMDEVLFSSVIEACLRIGRLDLLSEQTRKFARQGGMGKLSAPTYGSMIKAYGQARDVERMWELWNEMEKREVQATSITLGCMVDALVKNQCVEDAWDLVHVILDDASRCKLVNNIIYSTILKGFAMTKQTDRLFTVYSEMRSRSVEANTVTYNTMLDACARCGAMDRAPQLLADMRSARITLDTITYSTLVKGHCLSGNVDSAFEVLAEMRADGRHKPDEILYNCLLDGCAKDHRLEAALELYDEMKAQGVKPSNFTLCTLVKLLGRARQLQHAFAIVKELSTTGGLKPNIQVYTCLLQACIHNRQMQRALELHDEIIAARCEPDQKTYTVLVRGCVNAGSLQKAVEVVRCAYLLPGSMLARPSKSQGVEMKMLEEVIMRLNQGSAADAEEGRNLVADLRQYRGLNMQDNVYSQVVREAARNTHPRGQRAHNGW